MMDSRSWTKKHTIAYHSRDGWISRVNRAKIILNYPLTPGNNNSKETIWFTGGNPTHVKRENLKAIGYDLEEVEKGKATMRPDSKNLLQKKADNKPVDSTTPDDEPEVTIMRRKGVGSCNKNLLNAGDPWSKEVVRTLDEKIPEEILKQTTPRRKRVSFKEEAEELGLDQESSE